MLKTPANDPNDPVDFDAIRDDYIEEYLESDQENKRLIRFRHVVYVLVVGLCIAAVTMLTVYAYRYSTIPRDPQQLPLIISNDDTPFKERPVDPGGMQVKHMDKKVYEQLSETAPSDRTATGSRARVLPQPEQPVARDQLAERYATPPSEEAEVLELFSENAPKSGSSKRTANVKPSATSDSLRSDDSSQSAVRTTMDFLALQQKKTARKDVPPSKDTEFSPNDIKTVSKQDTTLAARAVDKSRRPASSQKTATMVYRVQLGAFRSEGDAIKAWKNIHRKFSKELTDFQSLVERADLGSKGVFYRLKAGPTSSKSEARRICAKMREKSQDCFVVKG